MLTRSGIYQGSAIAPTRQFPQAARRGAAFEIRLLAERKALKRTVILIDIETDLPAIEQTIVDIPAWHDAATMYFTIGWTDSGGRYFCLAGGRRGRPLKIPHTILSRQNYMSNRSYC